MKHQCTHQKYFALLLVAVITLGGFADSTRAAGVSGPADANLTMATQAAANDNFANAQPLFGTGFISGTTIGASKETGELAHARNRGGASIWFKYEAAAPQIVTFDTNGSNFDTLLAVYKGPTLDSLKLIAANDDAPTGTTSIVRVGAAAGDIFYVAVDGYYSPSTGTVATGNVGLNYAQTAAPGNDNFASAQLLTGPSGRLITATNVGATAELGDPHIGGNAGGRSLWYKWVAPSGSNRSYTFTIESINATAQFGVTTPCAILTGPNLSSLTTVTYNNNTNVNNLTFVPTPGTTYYLFLDGYNSGSGAQIGTFTIGYGVTKDAKAADFDRDGRSDITVFRPSTGTWYTINSVTDQVTSQQFGTAGDQPFLLDMDDDGRLDRTVYRPSTGAWYVNGTSYGLQAFNWGTAGDIPLVQQSQFFKNFAVFRPSTSYWYFVTTFGYDLGYAVWGTNGDVPLSIDFLGNGGDERTVFRPSTGTWYSIGAANLNVQFGMNGDKPVPADYDGDGKMDIAVFRPSNGTWYILRSSDNGVTAMQWGQAGDIPQPADYDGDGRSDVAVFRGGTWYILPSQSFTLRVVQFGLPGDIPVTAPIH